MESVHAVIETLGQLFGLATGVVRAVSYTHLDVYKRQVGRCILGSVAVTDFAFTARMLQKYGDKIAVGGDAKEGYCLLYTSRCV